MFDYSSGCDWLDPFSTGCDWSDPFSVGCHWSVPFTCSWFWSVPFSSGCDWSASFSSGCHWSAPFSSGCHCLVFFSCSCHWSLVSLSHATVLGQLLSLAAVIGQYSHIVSTMHLLTIQSFSPVPAGMPNPTGMVYTVYTVPVDYPALLTCTSQYA